MLRPIESLHLRRIAKLIEFSSEAALNAEDSYFLRHSSATEPDKEIIYVFDPSAFHFAINPVDIKRKYSAYFHLLEWRDNLSDISNREYWTLLNEMTAILTSEFMFSGQLKGQRENRIYMSIWHFDQLLGACAAYLLKIYDDSATDSERVVHRRRLVRNQIKAVLDNRSDHWAEHDDELLAADERDFQEAVNRSTEPLGIQEAGALRLARRLARVIAQGREALIPDQLRFVTGLIDAGKVESLEQRFNLSAADLDRIGETAETWRSRLAERDSSRSSLSDIPQRREHGIEDDALSVAMIQYISRTKIDHSKQRVIFVTGDQLVLDTYREWYADAYLRDPTEPNVLRAIGYFSPIMNMSDMRGLSHSPADLFELLQVALNITLMPFNLMSYKDIEAGSDLIKRQFANLSFLRAQLLMKAEDKKTVLDNFLKDAVLYTINSGGDTYIEIIKKYQALERNVFRVGLDLIQSRAARHIHDTSEFEESDQSDAYFAEVIVKLVGSSAQLYAPLIDRIILRGASRLRPHPRAAVALRIESPPSGSGEKLNIVAWVERMLQTAKRNPGGHPRPKRRLNLAGASILRPSLAQVRWPDTYLVLVVGAIIALRRGFWLQAGRFADGAKVAFRHLRQDSATAELGAEAYPELRYLAAFTARYIIGSMRPTEGGGGEDVWLKYLSKATSDLDHCVEYYRKAKLPLFELRSVAERASCNLFYASWALAGPDLAKGGYSDQQALDCLEEAVRELTDAFYILRDIPSDGRDDELVVKNVRRQVFGSIASAFLVAGFLSIAKRKHRFSSSLLRDVKKPFEEWQAGVNPAELPEVVRVECRLFASRIGLPDLWSDSIVVGKPTARLALDDLLIKKFGPSNQTTQVATGREPKTKRAARSRSSR